jgi:hypothetical protein
MDIDSPGERTLTVDKFGHQDLYFTLLFPQIKLLTCCTSRNTVTLSTCLSSSNLNPFPSPIRARITSTKDMDVCSSRFNVALNTLKRKISDRNTGCRDASRISILVVLFNDDAIGRDRGESYVRVSYARDTSCCSTYS